MFRSHVPYRVLWKRKDAFANVGPWWNQYGFFDTSYDSLWLLNAVMTIT